MASERQIAANRRNAQKSTGPQTYGGKKRIGKNAYRHGLAARMMSSFELDKQISSPEPMPLLEPERSAEAVRRSLPELVKLDRYEHRASSRRDRAIRELTAVLRRERS